VTAEPLILEIKGNSLDDGPGIRTVVFFKGCPLDCSWCHNPESKKAASELSYDADACVDCGRCIAVCERRALDRSAPGYVDRGVCDVCGACADECPSGALEVVGRRMSVSDVVREVRKDLPFFENSGGGVTLSGGEPALFMEYCSSLLSRLKEEGVHTIVETSGFFDRSRFERLVLPHVDALYFDLKIFDEEQHRAECGVSNTTILTNFKALVKICAASGKELLGRVPLIPGITATDENLERLADFLRESGAGKVALLQYNPLWLDKTRKLGRPAAGERPGMRTWMDRAQLDRCREAFVGLEIS